MDAMQEEIGPVAIPMRSQVPMADTVSVLLLGDFGVWVEKDRVDFPRSAARLIAFLALQDRPVSRIAVAGALWPDLSPEKSHASLRTVCWRARRACRHLVGVVGNTLQLHSDVHSDVGVLRGIGGSPRGSPGDTWTDHPPIGALQLLPEWEEDWVVEVREYYRVLALQSLERLSAWHRERGNYHSAAQSALTALHLEPLRESAHRALIAIDLDQGNQAEALRHYHRYREMLERDLALAPSPQVTGMLHGAGLNVLS